MDPRRSKIVGRLSAGLVVVVGLGAYVLALIQLGARAANDSFTLAALTYVAIGALILAKANVPPVGWVVSLIGLSILVLDVADQMEWSSSWGFLWLLGFILLAFLFLLFPTGRPPGPRWRWMVGAGMSLAAGSFAFSSAFPDCEQESFAFCQTLEGAIFTGMGIFLALSVVGLAIRYRASVGLQRQQLKWFLAAVVTVLTVTTIGDRLEDGLLRDVVGFAFAIPSALIPAAIAVAVFRYRLYDIDRIVSRTVTYLIVAGVSGGVFFAGVTAVSSLLPTQGSLAVAGSTMAVAAIFNPIRRRIQRVVDRRFNRSRYDAERVMAEFAGGLSGRLDAAGVARGWVGVVAETMHPTVAGVWVREPR